MLKSDNVVIIHGWMCNELELKGTELLVFALIYGFSQDGASSFFGGRKYIAKTFNISLPTVDKALNGLIDKDYIAKESGTEYNSTDSYYVKNMVVKKLYGGGKETLPYNISNTKKQTILSKDSIVAETTSCQSESTTKKPNLFQKCVSMSEDYTQNETLREQLKKYVSYLLAYSKESGRPFYANMWKSKLTKLAALSENEDMQIKIVQQSIDNGWANFYEYKDGGGKRTGDFAKDVEHLSAGLNSRAERRDTSGKKF